MERVLTGALALIMKDGSVIGRMKNIRWSETFQDQEVRGLGTIYVQEAPITGHAGTWSCDFYEIDFKLTGIPGAIRRDVADKNAFEDNLLLRDPFSISIFKKIEDALDVSTGLKTSTPRVYATINGLFINSDGADITEGSISGHQQSGRFLEPVIYSGV